MAGVYSRHTGLLFVLIPVVYRHSESIHLCPSISTYGYPLDIGGYFVPPSTYGFRFGLASPSAGLSTNQTDFDPFPAPT